METPFQFQFESDTVDNPKWVRCRIWYDPNYDQPGEVFEIGEPVHLDVAVDHRPTTHVYWIKSFESGVHENDEHVVLRICAPESDLHDFVPIYPKHLKKLPDMLRIAVEANRPRA